jgi:hypothetical protein
LEIPVNTPTTPATTTATAALVVVVDDERPLRDLVARILTRFGYRVMVAATPHEALQWAENHAETIDLLLTDVVMPDLTGPKLAERFVAIHPETQVLFMCGYSPAILGASFDPEHFLQKPFAAKDLLGKVRSLLERRSPPTPT